MRDLLDSFRLCLNRAAMGIAIPLVVLAQATTGPEMLLAQAVDSGPSLSMLQLRGVTTGKSVRVSRGGARLQGSFAGVSDGRLVLGLGEERDAVVLSEIDSLWVRGRSTKTGALIGALTIGAGLGIFGASVSDELGGKSDQGFGAGLLIGAPAGALLGAAVGAVIPKWRRRYP